MFNLFSFGPLFLLFKKEVKKILCKLNDGHKKLAQKLISLHQTINPYTLLPKYNYDQLQKGICCTSCKSLLISIKNNHFVCGKCGENEGFEQAILRGVKEFKLLFPERKITTQSIYEWPKVDLSKEHFAGF